MGGVCVWYAKYLNIKFILSDEIPILFAPVWMDSLQCYASIEKKWPEKLRRYAPTKGNKEKKERCKHFPWITWKGLLLIQLMCPLINWINWHINWGKLNPRNVKHTFSRYDICQMCYTRIFPKCWNLPPQKTSKLQHFIL